MAHYGNSRKLNTKDNRNKRRRVALSKKQISGNSTRSAQNPAKQAPISYWCSMCDLVHQLLDECWDWYTNQGSPNLVTYYPSSCKQASAVLGWSDAPWTYGAQWNDWFDTVPCECCNHYDSMPEGVCDTNLTGGNTGGNNSVNRKRSHKRRKHQRERRQGR